MKHKDFIEWLDDYTTIVGITAMDGVIICIVMDNDTYDEPRQWFEVDRYKTDSGRERKAVRYNRWLNEWRAKQ